MKIFLDTGDVEEVRKAYDTGLVDGTSCPDTGNTDRHLFQYFQRLASTAAPINRSNMHRYLHPIYTQDKMARVGCRPGIGNTACAGSLLCAVF